MAPEQYASGVEQVKTQFQDAGYVQELYYDQMQSLYDSYRTGRITAEDYNAAIKNTQAAYKDGTFAAEQQKGALSELHAQYDSATKKILADLLLLKMTADGAV